VYSVEINKRAIEAGKRFPTTVSLLDAVIDQFADAVGHVAERLGNELDGIEDTIMRDEPSDHRPRIGRIRLQAVRVHRQLALLRGIFHRLEPRVAAEHAPVAQAVRALAQKLDAIDHDGRLVAGTFAPAARRDRCQDVGDHQPPPIHALGSIRLLAAANAGDRILRLEHQRHALAKHRRRHLAGPGRGVGRQRTQLLDAEADARVLMGGGAPLRRTGEHS
jgi:hypothetical protein